MEPTAELLGIDAVFSTVPPTFACTEIPPLGFAKASSGNPSPFTSPHATSWLSWRSVEVQTRAKEPSPRFR